MLKSSLCDYSNAYIVLKGNISGAEKGGDADARRAAKQAEKQNEKVIFKNWAPFTNCIIEINNPPKCCDADV